MKTTHNAMLAAVCLGALHDILLHAVVGDHAVQEPEPGPAPDACAERNDTSDFGEERDDRIRGFAPGSRASADMSGRYAKASTLDTPPEAASADWIAGVEHARRQFAQNEEARFAQERAIDRERMDQEMHANFRHSCLHMATTAFPSQPAEKHVAYAAKFYDFICYGAAVPNLGCATTQEIATELDVRLCNPKSAMPGYRTIDRD